MLLKLNTMLLRRLTRPTLTTMEVIVSSTMVMAVATISLVVAVVVVAAMAMAVGFVVVNSLTFSVKSVINMDMRQLYSNQHPNQYQNKYPNHILLINIQISIPVNLPIQILISLHIRMLHLNTTIQHHKLI